MPAYLNSSNPGDAFKSTAKWLSGKVTAELREQSAQHITIGLVNNMPDGALESTERQFLSLLDAASGSMHVRLSLYSMPGIYRKGQAASHVRTFYSGIENLWNTHLDGVIVTGREPLASNLSDEPYWDSFTSLLEWARESTYSAVWSCLAAHAAVLYCDGISRVRSRSKRCGVFECMPTDDHELTAGVGPSFALPHSRWNGVTESALKRRGYRVLSRSAAGADTFVKQYKSLFVFFQGHPEYDADTLMLEYRRDVGRFLRGDSDRYPTLPDDYFDEQTAARLRVFQEEAMNRPHQELLAEVYETLLQAKTEAPWRAAATQMYHNWLEYIGAQKELHLLAQGGVAEVHESKRSLVAIDATNPTMPNIYAKKSGLAEERPRRVATAR